MRFLVTLIASFWCINPLLETLLKISDEWGFFFFFLKQWMKWLILTRIFREFALSSQAWRFFNNPAFVPENTLVRSTVPTASRSPVGQRAVGCPAALLGQNVSVVSWAWTSQWAVCTSHHCFSGLLFTLPPCDFTPGLLCSLIQLYMIIFKKRQKKKSLCRKNLRLKIFFSSSRTHLSACYF